MAPKYEVSTIIPTQETGYSAARALGRRGILATKQAVTVNFPSSKTDPNSDKGDNLFMPIMPDENHRENFLDLSIEFEPRRVVIGFRNTEQAAQYQFLITAKAFTQTMKLDPRRHDRLVSVRLPSRVLQIEASTAHHGFFLCSKDADFAKQWKEALILWNSMPGNPCNLYLKRDISNEDLNALLCIDERPDKSWEPGPAGRSLG
ncbi:hypothetical protein CIB48_g7327 [Xylaria polymorpha]|nr:hypothetical protein CIB48_g7327 [Xylaria polymorpha]